MEKYKKYIKIYIYKSKLENLLSDVKPWNQQVSDK